MCLVSGNVHSDEQDDQLGVAREMVGLLEAYAVYKMGQYDLALDRFQKLADQGSFKAMYNLGNMYSDGLGVSQSHVKAFHWYRRAADAGHHQSMLEVAHALEEGKGVEQDKNRADRWRARASESVSQ